MLTHSKINKGGILTLTLLIGLAGVSFVLGFYGWAMNTSYYHNRSIAKTKAFYNAETGMARKAYGYLWKKDFIDGYDGLKGEEINKNMGSYLDPEFAYSQQGNRMADVYGIHEIKSSSGSTYLCSVLVSLPAKPQTLAAYMYLTDSELAGGAPAIIKPGTDQRRDVYFGSADILEGLVQTNGEIKISSNGCPDFEKVELNLTNGTDVNFGNACNGYNALFQYEDVDTVTKPPVQLPPVGYQTLKAFATHTIPANMKIFEDNWTRDTLIMTDIEFKWNGEYRVRQWWYLVPPHLKPGSNVDAPDIEHLDLDDAGQCLVNCDGCVMDDDDSYDDCEDWDNPDADVDRCNNSPDCYWNEDSEECIHNWCEELTQTNAYRDFMASYHGKYAHDNSNWDDRFLFHDDYYRPTTGPAGLHHYDIDEPIGMFASNIVLDQIFAGSDNTIIYIQDGPVRVWGEYKGRYTVVTDEYTLYNRHAWPQIDESPIDTIWNNIWITGDIINADAIDLEDDCTGSDCPSNINDGNLRTLQPSPDCKVMATQNIMGLVSGANVYIANSHANGRGNQGDQGNIIINAALMALNESFVVQYFQNSTTSYPIGDIYPLGFQNSHQLPFADARGDDYGTTGNSDYRGYIYLWGGIVQKNRGYFRRNPVSPYNQADIGMDKSYHYDENLDCNPPPFYPAIEFNDGSGEISINMAGYTSTF